MTNVILSALVSMGIVCFIAAAHAAQAARVGWYENRASAQTELQTAIALAAAGVAFIAAGLSF